MTGHVPKLVIIRGPSGAAKSTVARAVFEATDRPTVLVGRDHYMFMFNGVDPSPPDKELVGTTIRFCLDHGFDVVCEGNFKLDTHVPLLTDLFAAHADENYVFYLDVSLPETIRRHATRRQIITIDKMTERHPFSTPLGAPNEILIPESTSADDTVELILTVAGLTRRPG